MEDEGGRERVGGAYGEGWEGDEDEDNVENGMKEQRKRTGETSGG